jgi:hypothetical protein
LHLTIGRQYDWQPNFNPRGQLIVDADYHPRRK